MITTVKASENIYEKANTVVKGEDILTQIKNGNDIYLDNCSIVGELDINKINLDTVKDLHLENGFPKKTYLMIGRKVSAINNNITVINSKFEEPIIFSYIVFSQNVSFHGTSFNSVDFNYSNFIKNSDFSQAIFNGAANFIDARFHNANYKPKIFINETTAMFGNINESGFNSVTFNSIADFSFAEFYNADFSNAHFANRADFSNAVFDSTADFSRYTLFAKDADFSNAIFYGAADFSAADYATEPIDYEKELPKLRNSLEEDTDSKLVI
jgi:uncharacterized protein YjbI with pentapeptide repeats